MNKRNYIILVNKNYRYLVFGFFFFFSLLLKGAIVFNKENSPYIFNENFVLNAWDTLYISEGTTILLGQGVDIVIHGNTFIEGTVDEPVIFKPLDIDGDWGRIDISGNNIRFEMTHAIVNNGTIHAINTDVKLTYVEFVNDQTLAWNNAIARIIKGPTEIRNCSINGNYQGEGFLIHESENAIIQGCYFEAIPDAIEFISMKNSLIRKNTFYDIIDDAIDLNHSENILVDSNFISNIQDRGFEIGSETFGSSKNIQVVRNIIANCDEGVTFKEGSTGTVTNCSLYGNRIGVTCIEDVAGFGGSEARIENTIIANSLEKDIDKDNLSTVDILYSLSDTESLPGSENLFDNPAYLDPEAGDFRLHKNSPCINSGNPATPPDPDNTIADMGALYRDINTSIGENLGYLEDVKIYPNPFVDEFTIEFELKHRSLITVKIYSLNGRELETLTKRKMGRGKRVLTYDLAHIGAWSGGHIQLRLWVDSDTKSFKLVRRMQ